LDSVAAIVTLKGKGNYCLYLSSLVTVLYLVSTGGELEKDPKKFQPCAVQYTVL